MLSSEGLAKELQTRMTQGQSDFTFVIGGSNGFTSRRLTTQQLRSIIQHYDLPAPNDARHIDRTNLSLI